MLALILAAASFAPLIEGGTTHLPVFILRALVAAALAVWMVSGASRGSLTFHRTPVDLAAVLFLAVAVFSAAFAPYKYMALTWLQSIMSYALFFYLARASLSREGAVGWAVAAVLLAGGAEAAWGIAQRLVEGGRADGSFYNPNMLAVYLVPTVVIPVSLLVNGHRRADRPGARAALACLAGLGVTAVVFSGSRGGTLVLLAVLFWVVRARSGRLAAAAAAALLLTLAVVPNPVKDHVMDRGLGRDPYAYSRAGIWRGAARMALDHPLGVGLGNFKYEWPRYNFPIEHAVERYGKLASTAHNEYLHIAAETGVAGLAAFLYGVFLLLRAIRPPADGEEDRALSIGLAGGVVAVLLHAAVDSNLHEPGIVFLLMLLSAAALEVRERGAGRACSVPVPVPARGRVKALACLLSLLLAAWAAKPALAYYFSEKARDALRDGRPAAAARDVGKALAFEPGNAALHDLNASILYSAFRGGGAADGFEEALDELGEARRLNPVSSGYPATEARILLDRAASVDDPAARRNLAWRALDASEDAARLSPYSAPTLFDKARLLLYLGRDEEAVETLERLAGYEPNFLRGRLLLAATYKDMGREDLSREECYSIIKAEAALGQRRLDEGERGFVQVDMDRVHGLLRGLGGAPG